MKIKFYSMKHILTLEEAAMMNPQTKKQMSKLKKQAGASAGSKKSSKDKTTTSTNIGKADTYGPKNESLIRDKSKKQMDDLNRTIKAAGGDIQDIVKKGEKVKEYQIPNAYYMDNPFDAKRTSIETQEHFVKNGAHYKSVPMKSKEQSNIIKLNAGVNENIDNDSLRTMNAHFQTYVFPHLTIEEQDIIKKLDIIIFKYNYDNETSVRLSFKTPENREDVYQLILVNVTYPIYKDMVKIVEKFDLISDYDNKNKLYLNIYYKNKKQNMNANRRINEGSYTTFLTNYGKQIKKALSQLRELEKNVMNNPDMELTYDDAFDNLIDKYDEMVVNGIDRLLMSSKYIDETDIAELAIRNQDRNGTEPQFLLFAIEDLYNSLIKDQEIMEGRRDKSEAEPSDDLKANFRSWEIDCDNEESAEELAGILSDRHPDYDFEDLRKMAYDWVGCEMNESVNEAKEFSKIKHKKVEFVEPFKKLKNLKHFHELSYDGDTTEKSNVNDDSWIKGRKEDFVRPMFKNLPDTTIRPSYDALRTGKMITLFGRECRVIGIKNGELTVDVMGKDDKHETEKYDMNDVMKELKKTQKKEKKSKK
jgi:hypothetical protein